MSLKNCKTFGRFKYRTCRHTCMRLIAGKPISKQKYSFRVNPSKLASCIQFVQDNLVVVPGLVRDVEFDGYILRNLPVYSSGGKSLMKFFDLYYSFYPIDQRIGRDNF